MKYGSIAAGDKTTVHAAMEILKDGGNAFDAAVCAGHLSQGDIKSAALTMLPGATGAAVSVAHKTTKTAVNVAESGKRGAAANVLTNQAVGDTQEHQNKKKK